MQTPRLTPDMMTSDNNNNNIIFEPIDTSIVLLQQPAIPHIVSTDTTSVVPTTSVECAEVSSSLHTKTTYMQKTEECASQCTRAALAVIGTKRVLRKLVKNRKNSTQSDWMLHMRPISLSVSMQTSCNLWRKKSELKHYIPRREKLHVGNAGESIHHLLQQRFGKDDLFDKEYHMLAGIECPSQHSNLYRHYDVVIPQGSRTLDDYDLRDTAVREFIEETGISLAQYGIHKPLPVSPWMCDSLCYHPSMYGSHVSLNVDDDWRTTSPLKFLGVVHQDTSQPMAVYVVVIDEKGSTLNTSHSFSTAFCNSPDPDTVSADVVLHCFSRTHALASQCTDLTSTNSQVVATTVSLETMHLITSSYKRAWRQQQSESAVHPVSPDFAKRKRHAPADSKEEMMLDTVSTFPRTKRRSPALAANNPFHLLSSSYS